MNYQEFKQYVLDNIRNYLPSELKECEVAVVPYNTPKMQKDALVVKRPGQAETYSYLRDYYKEYQGGRLEGSIVAEIGQLQGQGKPVVMGQLPLYDLVTDWQQIQPAIVGTVVSARRNAGLLEQVPHKLEGDMAIVYRIDYELISPIPGISLIDRSLFSTWGISQEKLHDVAIQNTQKVWPAKFEYLNEAIMQLANEVHPAASPDEYIEKMKSKGIFPIFLLSNQDKVYGATALFYPGIKEEIAKRLQGDYYILPGSVHEVIIVPQDFVKEAEGMRRIINRINRSMLDPKDCLTDRMYVYDQEMQQVLELYTPEEKNACREEKVSEILRPEDLEPEL